MTIRRILCAGLFLLVFLLLNPALGSWDDYKDAKLRTRTNQPTSKLETAKLSDSDKKTQADTFSLVYTRVPRTHGQHDVTLKNGSSYRLESPDIWDKLPDSANMFDGFNAPGQLVLRFSDGSEKILYDCVTDKLPCVPLDPSISFDGKKLLFSLYKGSSFRKGWWAGTTLPNLYLGVSVEAQLHVIDLASGDVTPLTHSPGNMDVSPAWLPDGRIIFASTRAGNYRPWLDRITPRGKPEPQLFIANADGSDAKNITPHELSTAMHPFVLKNGRVAYSSLWMSHNLAYGGTNGGVNWPNTIDNMWMVSDVDSNGGDMTALLGAHRASIKDANGRRKTMKALHFLGQRKNGDICVDNYYRGNNLGLGDIFCWTPEPKGIEGKLPHFLPRNIYSVATWSKSNDEPSWKIDGIYQGKIGYPEGLDNNELMLTVGRGYCTDVTGTVVGFQKAVENQPEKRACDTGIYQTTQIPSVSMSDLSVVVDRPEWHEFGARIVRGRAAQTSKMITTGNDTCQLASSDAGTAETSPSQPYQFNKNYKASANHGGEIDGLSHSELAGIRFYEIVPNHSRKRGFKNSIGNKLKLLGDVPLLKDKSFKVELPCDTPYLMAGIDTQGLIIKRDQVPQSLRPGEKRVCTGCHLHSKAGRSYEKSKAFTALPISLSEPSPVPSYEKDIKPIFIRHCVACHTGDVPLMDYSKLVWDYAQEFVPDDRKLKVRESKNPRRRYGLQRPYSSRYVNTMFARESLLYWKAANQRMDGRADETYPNDIDFGANHPSGISATELKVLGNWLDSGAGSVQASP
tara:strand:+ start:72636 stop:75023 length:2388 start_codon:yes stop_codon:yes gene_type:complete